MTLPRLPYQQKNEEFYELLGKVFKLQSMECLELFSRRKNNEDFDVWGNEVPGNFQAASRPKEVCLVYEDEGG